MDNAAADFAEKISDRFDVVCFDLDQCAVQCHSRGRLLRKDLDDFASKISPDFVRAIPELLNRGIKIAIVTHSDLAQHGPSKPRRGPDAFVFGDELVQEILLRVVPEYAHEFFIVAWRPKSRGAEGTKDPGKIRHMRTSAAFYGVALERCVLFDDDATNCTLTNCNGERFSSYKVNPDVGFRFTDFQEKSNHNYFSKRSDGSVDRLGRWNCKWNYEYEGKPRFHLTTPNPNLVEFYGKDFCPSTDLPILLPLCGKTLDLQWLANAGHNCVVGVEGVQQGIEELRDDIMNNLQPKRNSSGLIWTTAPEEESWFRVDTSSNSKESARVSIVCADFFEISPMTFNSRSPCFGSVYDRGAIVAVPPHSRHEYVEVIDSLLIPGGQILMITVDSRRDSGPPFPITPGVVEELFSTRDYSIQVLDEHDGTFGAGSKEYVFLLTKTL